MEEKRKKIQEKLGELLTDYVEIDGELKPDMSLTNDIGIDSFSLVCLIGNIEETFELNIPTEKLIKFQTISDMVDYIYDNSKVA